LIDPVIFTIGNFSLRWYGVIVMIGVIAGSLIVERELKRRGENPDSIWDALVWWVSFGPLIKTPIGNFRLGLPLGVLPIGIVGARLWYVMNATLGGSRIYLDDPSLIYKVWEGGLHIFGGFLFGAVTLLLFLRSRKLDPWLFLDSAGPAVLIGQGIGRIANFINQELYGPPTTLLWGIQIEAQHRLAQYRDMNLFPFETTRFHPTFAYEMLWNFAAAGFLIWLSRRYKDELKPGTLFAGWLVLAGIGRVWIEFFRPDQPKIEALGISYSAIFAAFMAVVGAILLMARYKAINLKFAETWEEEYQIAGQEKPAEEESVKEDEEEEEDVPRVRRVAAARAKAGTVKKSPPARRAISKTSKKTSSQTTGTKKSQ
jgi:phosphatidylglycerol---prolipoprotein diacylglyceryl transferase